MENNIENETKPKEEENNNKINNIPLINIHKKRNSIYSKFYINIKEELSKKRMKNASLGDLNDKEIQDLYSLIKKDNKEKNKKDNLEIFLFLLKTKFKENVKSDLLYTDYSLDNLYNFINPYISGNIYNSGEVIYSYGDEADNFYIILKGNIGQYKIVIVEESLTCEDYYTYLYSQFHHYKKTMLEELNDKNNIYIKETEYTDIELLRKIININKEVYPLYMFDDIEDLKEIMIIIKIYLKIIENKSNEIIEIYNKYEIPLTFLNYDKLLKNDISPYNFTKNVSRKIDKRENFYMTYLGKNQESKVKIMKYEKINDLKPFDYFGNFEMIDSRPTRIDTARCENDNTVLMLINKRSYSKIINDLQREKRNQEIYFLHNYFYFKIINRIHFESKMYIKFKIDSFLKGNILINQDEKINNFIFVREGTIETSINNISLFELSNKIKILNDFIVKKAKEYDINIKDIIDFDVTLKNKTSLQYQLVEEILKQKQSFVLSKTEKCSFGDYEFFFNVPSFITATIMSKSGKVYFYDYENFKKVNEEVHAFNETLKEISFSKLKSILKRMVTIYNSYLNFNIKQVETKLKENENKLKKLNSPISIKEEGDLNLNYNFEQQKHFSSPITVFKKSKINIFNIINTNIDKNKDSLEKHNNYNKNKILYSFSNNLEKIKKFKPNIVSQIKVLQSYNSLSKKKFNLNKSLNKKQNKNSLSSDNSLKEKKIIVFNRNKEIKLKKNLFLKNSKNNKQLNVLKTENSIKKKLYDVFLPPLLTAENIKNKEESDKIEKFKINYHLKKHSLSIENSINDISLGHKSKNSLNNNNMFLSNLNEKKSNNYQKKSKSINIKRAQINIIKNRSKIIKKVLQKKNEEDLYYDKDI